MPRSVTRSHAVRLSVALVATLLLAACGTTQGPNPPRRYDDARSQTCADVSGVRALYWDFLNGTIRTDYPETYRFIPYVGTPFIHPAQPLYSFTYPPGWQAFALSDPALQLMGANVVRADGQAVWRRLNLTLTGTVSAGTVVGIELDTMAANLGLSGSAQVRCSVPAQVDPSTGFEIAAVLVDWDGFTGTVHVQAFPSGGLTVAFIQMTVAPTDQYDETALNVFFPLSGQMLPGGGSGPADCSDGQDNDGDGKVDYPNDPGCSSPDDDSEVG